MIIADVNSSAITATTVNEQVSIKNELGYDAILTGIVITYPNTALAERVLLTRIALGKNGDRNLISGRVQIGAIGKPAGADVRVFPLQVPVTVPASETIVLNFTGVAGMVAIPAGALSVAFAVKKA
jgi:hypothetical protein